MQHLPVYSDKQTSAQPALKYRTSPPLLAGSRSLASMLPSLLSTGVATLLFSALLRLLWIGFTNDFFAAWMEAWLTTWPIAFPMVYISKRLYRSLTKVHQTRHQQSTTHHRDAKSMPSSAMHARYSR